MSLFGLCFGMGKINNTSKYMKNKWLVDLFHV